MVSRVVTMLVLLALAGLSGTSTAGAKALVASVPDPARDIMVTDKAVLVPVDSIDIIAFDAAERSRGLVEASITVSDLTRQGLEDRLFVHSAHTVRVYGVTTLYEEFRVFQLLLALVDDDPTPHVVAFEASPEGITFIPATGYVDVASGTIGWRLDRPVDGAVSLRFATATMHGCDDMDTCDPGMPGVFAFDMAPNDLASANAVVVPGVWWNELMPEDDGSVPKAPVSAALVSETALQAAGSG